MRSARATLNTRDVLSLARKVANHATALGASQVRLRKRPCLYHLGAIMADATLQSGVNYRTVVYPRVVVILDRYPEACTLQGVKAIISADRLAEFLRWQHATKLRRFLELALYFDQHHVETPDDLRSRFNQRDFRYGLLGISGIGSKTADYLGCLTGVDVVAVDRHIQSFARDSGLEINDYESLQAVFSCAADLLEFSRRDFDLWVWTMVSSRRAVSEQRFLPFRRT